MHMVHWKTAYGDVATAKTKSDGLAVLGILFKADHDNHEYEALEVILFLVQYFLPSN